MRQVTRWIVLCCMLAAAGLSGGCITLTKPEVLTPSKNQVSSDTAFVLSNLSGKDIKFPDDFSGKRVLLVFFSTG